eukprot:1060487-Amphidinium_carterae.1
MFAIALSDKIAVKGGPLMGNPWIPVIAVLEKVSVLSPCISARFGIQPMSSTSLKTRLDKKRMLLTVSGSDPLNAH